MQRHRKVRSPFDGRAPLLRAARGRGRRATRRWRPGSRSLFEHELILDGALAQSSSQAAELWTLREGISESLSATGLPHKNDIALPVHALEAFCAELDAVFAANYPDWEICLFGHIGDGNLHVNIMKPDTLEKAEFLKRTSQADHVMFELVQKHQGSISAEHGIGLLKKPYLHYSRSPAELAAAQDAEAGARSQRHPEPGQSNRPVSPKKS